MHGRQEWYLETSTGVCGGVVLQVEGRIRKWLNRRGGGWEGRCRQVMAEDRQVHLKGDDLNVLKDNVRVRTQP